ncbi:hypothetical protein ABZ924_31475 [Streptomyces sp. NPDC046876]|uniref:hypothetical protein n=1 Tax=Streptomyces sp. NPDC046876 TaxID=3155616 RepID=UPI0033EC5E3A
MAPQREIDEDTAGGRLALFLVDLTKTTPVRGLADRFGRSSSSWGNYLNGSQLIPKELVGRLVESFTPPGPMRKTKAVHALRLWNAADAERRASRSPSGAGELVRHHQRRDDALQQVIKYQALAANAEKHLAELRPMLAYTQSRLQNAELQLKLGDERERARLERQLGQARERLGRVQVQQERASGRRMTAEEQQEFWMAEVLAAQEEIRRLERETQELAAVPPATPVPAPRDAADVVDDESDFEARLEHITAEGLEDEALIEEDLQPAPTSEREEIAEPPAQALQDPVQPVSNQTLDKPATSNDGSPKAMQASAAELDAWFRSLPRHEAPAEEDEESRPLTRRRQLAIYLGLIEGSDEELDGFDVFVRRKVLSVPLLSLSWILYAVCQSIHDQGKTPSSGWLITQSLLAALICLPTLYGSLRAATLPKRPARIVAVLLHTAWTVLFLLDRLPWPPIGHTK